GPGADPRPPGVWLSGVGSGVAPGADNYPRSSSPSHPRTPGALRPGAENPRRAVVLAGPAGPRRVLPAGLVGWLGREDSNLRSGIQSPAPYRLATPQAARPVAPPPAAPPAIESGGPAAPPGTPGPPARPPRPPPPPPPPPP